MSVRIRAVGVAMALAVLAGCGGEKPLGPTTGEFNAERQALVAELARGKRKDRAAPGKATGREAGEAAGLPSLSAEFHYDPTGRRDPFRSYEWEYLNREIANAEQAGPLEQYELGQLALLGVVWDVGRARALVQDPSGMSYVVAAGARMGKNEGLVTRIDDNLVVVRERYVDLYGNESTKDIELRIRASDGG